MSFIQNDPRLVEEQVSNNTLQDGGQVDTSSEAQNSPSNAPQGVTNTPTYNPPKNNATAPKSSPRSGLFTNIRNYVDKNKAASENLAKNVGETIQRKQDIAQKNLQNVQDRFKSTVDAQSLQNRDTAVGEVEARTQQAAGRELGDQAQQAADDKRIQDIFNAKYGGVRNLFETGGYSDAKRMVESSGQLGKDLKTPANYRNVLEKTVSVPGRAYTSGQKNLDELLFGGKAAQQQLQQSTQNLQDMGQVLNQAESGARSLATQTAQDVDRVRQEARAKFNELSKGRQGEIDQRLSQVVDNWEQMPEYFRDIFRKQAGGDVSLSALEAQTLGLQGGEQLFDALKQYGAEGLIKSTQAEKDRLVSQQEQQQLANLQNIAKLASDYGNEASGIDYKNIYTDAERAGTQSALDAIDVANLQSKLQETLSRGQDYLGRDYTETGFGRAKYRKGGKKRKVDQLADATASLSDTLNKDYVDRILGTKAQDLTLNQDLSGVKNIAKYLQDSQNLQNTDTSNIGNVNKDKMRLDSTDFSGSQWAPEDLLLGGAQAGFDPLGGLGTALGVDIPNLTNFASQVGADYGDKLNLINMPGFKELGELGTAIFGGSKTAANAKARMMALQNAQDKLKNTLQGKITEQGIGNQINVSNTDSAVKQRQQNLLNLLQNIDKSNL